jgi:hypothetical protein
VAGEGAGFRGNVGQARDIGHTADGDSQIRFGLPFWTCSSGLIAEGPAGPQVDRKPQRQRFGCSFLYGQAGNQETGSTFRHLLEGSRPVHRNTNPLAADCFMILGSHH